MTIDVESLRDRRADDRFNRVAVGDVLERVCIADPQRIAMVAAPSAACDPRFARVSYGEAEETACRVANGLLALGCERCDRVAMLCNNSVEAYLAKLAIAKAGLVALPINPMLAPDVVEAMLRHVGATVAIVDADLWSTGGAAFAAAGVTPVAAIRAAGGAAAPGLTDFADFAASAPSGEPELRIHGDDVWEILLTSGTTALPKAVMVSHTYSHMAALSHALSYTRGLRFESDFRTCTFLPVIYHVGHHAYVLAPLLCGGSVVFGRRPAGDTTAAAVTRERPTCLWGGSPQFLEELAGVVDADPMRYDLSSLTAIVYGWSALSPGLVVALERICGPDVRLVGLFGQTEAIACHRFWPERWPDLHRRTAPEVNYVGLPGPLLGAVIVGPDGHDLRDEPGAVGEAVYRSPAMASGYFRDEPATREAFRDGWFHSGDSCAYDEDGLRIMIDRYKDVIKSGGENVSSLRVESVLLQHPGVSAAAVVGMPDERWGEAVTGVVVLRPGEPGAPPDLIAFCRERLAGYETPKRIVVAAELPVTVGGKVLKYRLREMLAVNEI